MINIYDESFRKQAVHSMIDIVDDHEMALFREFHAQLTQVARDIQSEVDMLAKDEGKWYRPSHNLVVNSSMCAMIQGGEAQDDMFYVAQLHDAGYEGQHIAMGGPGWEDIGVRDRHMIVGSDYCRTRLTNDAYILGLNGDRIEELAQMVGVHDNPYLGIPIVGEARALRSADRCFVPSVISWYKDMLAYVVSEAYMQKVHDLGGEYSPEMFLDARIAFFFDDGSPFDRSFRPELASFNEGGGCEPCYTQTEKGIVTRMIQSRIGELGKLGDMSDASDFKGLINEAYLSEMEWLMAFAFE